MDNKGINNANYKHGMTNTKFYNTWKSMKRRCYCKTFMAYCNYGGRGIVICDRWLDFNNFKKDMYKSYLLHVDNFGENDTSIERIDVNGNYEIGRASCRER